MAKKLDVEARVSVKDAASKNIKKIDKGFAGLTKRIRSGAAAQIAALAGVYLGFRQLARGLTASVKAALEQESAMKRLETATNKLGSQAGTTAEGVAKFAAELQNTTTVSDETAISIGAFLLQMGVAPKQINEAIKASADLASSLGIDLQSAARNVGKTVGGFAGELGEVIPELKTLSTEALQAGEGIALLAEKFKGAAEKEAETFAGKLKQLSNALGDMGEGIGEALTESKEFTEDMDSLKTKITNITPSVADWAELMLKLAVGFAKVVAAWGEWQAKLHVGAAKMLGFLKIQDDTAVSVDALADSAARQGLTIEQVKKKMDAAAGANRLLGKRTREAAAAMDDGAEKTLALAEAQAKLDEEAKKAKTAMEKLATALGTVASAEIAAEIKEIEDALETARTTTGGFGLEFQKLEETATEKIKELNAQMEGLQNGLGDVGTTTAETTEKIDDMGIALESAGGAADTTGGAMKELGGALKDTNADTATLVAGLNNVNATLRTIQGQAVLTAHGFDTLSASAGRAAAVAAALEAGGTLTQSGTRLQLPGGYGSRLVNVSGRTSLQSYSLSPFGTGGTYQVDEHGNMRPA